MKNLTNKKAQGLSMNVIIIAAIALVVLIVLVIVFIGKSKHFGTTTSQTSQNFDANKCQIPGTSNECMGDEEYCREAGGSFSLREYSDCGNDGCCMK